MLCCRLETAALLAKTYGLKTRDESPDLAVGPELQDSKCSDFHWHLESGNCNQLW